MQNELNDIFEKYEKEMYAYSMNIQADYNYLDEMGIVNDELYKYIKEILDCHSNLYNALSDAKYIVKNIIDINPEMKFFAVEIRGRFEEVYVKFHTVREVLIRFLAKVYQIDLLPNRMLSKNIVEKLSKITAIKDIVNKMYDTLNQFDSGQRNKILHEGNYLDKELDDIHTDEMIGNIHKWNGHKEYMKSRKNEFLRKRIDILLELCKTVISDILLLLDITIKEYGKNYDKLNKIGKI